MQEKQSPQDMIEKQWLEKGIEELYEDAPTGYIFTRPDGTIIEVNQTFTEWLGYEKEELIYKMKFQDLLSKDGQLVYDKHHLPLLNRQGFITEISFEIFTKEGNKLQTILNAIQKKDPQGKPVLNQITIADFSKRKQYEKELLQAKEKAEAAMQAKSHFFSSATHEIRTPVHTILGASDLLMQNDPRADQMELLNTLRFSASILLRLINDILDISKIEVGKLKLEERSFNLKLFAQNIIKSMQAGAEEKGIDLQLDLDDDMQDYFIGDSLTIGRILTNLLANSIKFTSKGFIRLRIEATPGGDDMHHITFSVSDTGIGIPAEKRGEIFDRFSQADDNISSHFGGTGLGLTICDNLLSLYNSTLHVKSEEGKGSTFYFTMELKEGQPTEEPENHYDQTGNALKGKYILMAEDNQSNIHIACKYFDKWDLKYDLAKNGEEAVELVSRNDYDLVLMDLMLPLVDGFEATRRIRALPSDKYRKLPVIALSASDRSEIKEKLEKSGITSMITKPFEPGHLYQTLVEYIQPGSDKSGKAPEKNKPADDAPPDQPAINLTEISQILENDTASINEYYEALIEDLQDVREGLDEAINTKNKSLYGDMAHKTLSFVRIFKANRFYKKMTECRNYLKSGQLDKMEETKPDLFRELDLILSILKREIEKANQ